MRLPSLLAVVFLAAIASGALSDAQIRNRAPATRSLARPRPFSTAPYQLMTAQIADRVVDSSGVVLGFCTYGSSAIPPPRSGYSLNASSDAELAVLGGPSPSPEGITYPKNGYGVRHYDDGVIALCHDSAYNAFYQKVAATVPHFDLMVGNQACTPEQQIYTFFQMNPWVTLWEQMNEPDNGQYNAWLNGPAGPSTTSPPSPIPFREAIDAFYRGQTYCFADKSECFGVEPHLGCPDLSVHVIPSQSLKFKHNFGYGTLVGATLPIGSTSADISVQSNNSTLYQNDKVTIGCGLNANYGDNGLNFPFETVTLTADSQVAAGVAHLTWTPATTHVYTLPSTGKPQDKEGYAMFAEGCIVPGGQPAMHSTFVSDQVQLHEVVYPEAQHIRGARRVPNLVLLNSPFASVDSFYHFLPTWSSPSPPPSAAPRMMALLDAVSLHGDCANQGVECPYPPGTGSSNATNPVPPNCGNSSSIQGRICAASVIGGGKPFVQSNTSPWAGLKDGSAQIPKAGFPPLSVAGKYGPRSIFAFANWLQQSNIEGRQYFAFGIDGASGCAGPFTATGFFYNPCTTVNGQLVETGAITPKPTYYELRQLMSMFADPTCVFNGIQPALNTCTYTPTSLSVSFAGDNPTIFASFNKALFENSLGKMYLVMWHGKDSWLQGKETSSPCLGNIDACNAPPTPENITVGIANHAPISATLVTVDTTASDETVLQAQQQNGKGVPNECPTPGSTHYFLCFVPTAFTAQTSTAPSYQQFNIPNVDDDIYILSWQEPSAPLRSPYRRPMVRHVPRVYRRPLSTLGGIPHL